MGKLTFRQLKLWGIGAAMIIATNQKRLQFVASALCSIPPGSSQTSTGHDGTSVDIEAIKTKQGA
jgi:hypothetical protein